MLEQEMLAGILAAPEGLRFEGLSVRYDAPVLPLYVMGEERFARVRDRIAFLHFNRAKPWGRPRADADWLERVWWQALDDAERPHEEPSLHRERRERLARGRALGAVGRLGAWLRGGPGGA